MFLKIPRYKLFRMPGNLTIGINMLAKVKNEESWPKTYILMRGIWERPLYLQRHPGLNDKRELRERREK